MKRLYALILVLGLFAVIVSGCSVYRPLQGAPLTTLDGVKVIGPAEGESCQIYLFGLPATGEDTIRGAIADAVSKTGGDTLINYSVDHRTVYPLSPLIRFVTKQCTCVTGTAVKFEK
ncbi:MAG: hypothetical protein JRJ79_01935 [Deltaproteobacteria bacterium]|nr:hypothetical protein [Deltaproteobacteria bacterium]MBW1793840.1 hypothetical protein [Deltaproteobacteria bacterium]